MANQDFDFSDIFGSNNNFSLFMASLSNGTFAATLDKAAPASPVSPAVLKTPTTPITLATLTATQIGAVTSPSTVPLDPTSVFSASAFAALTSGLEIDFSKFTTDELAAVGSFLLAQMGPPAGEAPGCSGCEFLASIQ